MRTLAQTVLPFQLEATDEMLMLTGGGVRLKTCAPSRRHRADQPTATGYSALHERDGRLVAPHWIRRWYGWPFPPQPVGRRREENRTLQPTRANKATCS